MRILFISSSNMMASHLAIRLKEEGHEVRLYIDDLKRKECLDGLIQKTGDWRKELRWVPKGRDGLIVFDDIGYGTVQDMLRKKGYSVFGGSAAADRLENDRQYAQDTFQKAGLKAPLTKNFSTIENAINFVKKHRGKWVIKQNGHASKHLNYVGRFANGSDTVNVLENYKKNFDNAVGTITLQRTEEGIEVGIARYFNGIDWVGPIEFNIEHKKLFPGDLGPSTSEMGTVAWYSDNENNPIFQKTLAKLKSYLQKIQYKGDIDINCIINARGVWPLEATPRFGSPIVYVHMELHTSPWGTLLKSIADGKPCNVRWKKGYGIVTLLATAPFPYIEETDLSPKGLLVSFDKKLQKNDWKHIYFEGVAFDKKHKKFYVADYQGYALYVAHFGKTVEVARKGMYDIIRKIYIPKMFYRNDIGEKFLAEGRRKLKNLGIF